MLSILIPTYNHECVLLVDELVNQIEVSGIEAEIIVMDDGSTNMSMLAENAAIEDMPYCRYIVSARNQGIAKTRNALMREARYDLLLFLDSDVWPKSDEFLKKYVAGAKLGEVVVGGIDYRRDDEAVCCPLRLRYGLKHEVKTVKARNRDPYAVFISSSFMIHRSVVSKVRFNESYDRYGHEDTEYGRSLMDARIPIAHIDNEVFHDNVDTSEQFLSKVRTSIQSLSMHVEDLDGKTPLLNLYRLLCRFHLQRPTYKIFKYFRPQMERHLLGQTPNMFILGVYKISYLCGVMML